MDTLATAESKRYGQLKPSDLDGNVFGYHLKSLLVDNYVSKTIDGHYTLTSKGKDYIVHRYENPLLQAHSIYLIALSQGDKWLLRERLIQPLIGMSGFVHGEPVPGESILETAQRRLTTKTGITANLRIHSSGLVAIMRGDKLESYSNTIIVVGETSQDITIEKDETGRNYWLSAAELTSKNVLPSCNDIVNRITGNDASSFDLSYKL